jgi:hypothetical protein
VAKYKDDREDLMRDGTAMVHRGRWFIDQIEVVVGFRSGGQASVYWGQDPVFQFNARHQLRRVYIDTVRLAADNGRLVKLRQDDETSLTAASAIRLERNPLSPELTDEIEASWRRCHEQLRQRVCGPWDETATVVGESSESFQERLRSFLESTTPTLQIAIQPGLNA